MLAITSVLRAATKAGCLSRQNNLEQNGIFLRKSAKPDHTCWWSALSFLALPSVHWRRGVAAAFRWLIRAFFACSCLGKEQQAHSQSSCWNSGPVSIDPLAWCRVSTCTHLQNSFTPELASRAKSSLDRHKAMSPKCGERQNMLHVGVRAHLAWSPPNEGASNQMEMKALARNSR